MCIVGGSEISSRALHTEAMAVCMEPPMIQRGDWLKTFGRPTSVRLKFYTAAPPNGREIPLKYTLGQKYYLGPGNEDNKSIRVLRTCAVGQPSAEARQLATNIQNLDPAAKARLKKASMLLRNSESEAFQSILTSADVSRDESCTCRVHELSMRAVPFTFFQVVCCHPFWSIDVAFEPVSWTLDLPT